MFLLFFLLFTLIFTVFENLLLASIFLFLVCIVLIIYQTISWKKIISQKLIYVILGWFILAMFAFWAKEYRYYTIGDEVTRTQLLVWTGVVDDISSQWKYIFNHEGNKYLLYSKKEYAIGDQLRIVWRLQDNRKKSRSSYRKISSWTFAVSLFSGSFDYPKWIKMKGRAWTVYETNSLLIDGRDGMGRIDGIGPNLSNLSNPSQSVWLVKKMKRGIQEKVLEVYGKGKIAGLLLGMLIGDRSQIPKSEYQSFIDSGLVHLIAVSGGNILMIVVFLQCILFFIPFYLRLGLILLTIIGYSLICGLDSSVFRAVLMGGLSMLALFWWREIPIWRLLAISCVSMLVINPYFLAYDSGFLLSYGALIGIVYFETLKQGKVETGKSEGKKEKSLIKKGLEYVYKSYISPSIWASVGIFPIIIFFMGKINVLGILGNLLVLPLVPFVMIYWFVSVWLYEYFKWEWFLWIEKILIQYIYKISDRLTQYWIFLSVGGLRFKGLILLIFVVFFVFWLNKPRDPDPDYSRAGDSRAGEEKKEKWQGISTR